MLLSLSIVMVAAAMKASALGIEMAFDKNN